MSDMSKMIILVMFIICLSTAFLSQIIISRKSTEKEKELWNQCALALIECRYPGEPGAYEKLKELDKNLRGK